MHFSQHFPLLLAVVFFHILPSNAYDYSQIRQWNASCSPKDTCSIPRDLDDSDHHNCDCSSLCVLYDTCCIDSPFLNISSKYERSASCRSAGPSAEYVFMVDVCPASYEGPLTIRRRCEQNAKDWSDPFNNLPVTHALSQKTYKSLFCALCNGEDPKELVMWQVTLDCSNLKGNMKMCTEDRDFVLSNMMYIREKGLWGIWSYDPESDWMFRYLTINFKIPEGVKKSVKECRPNLVSDCHPTWKDLKIMRLCKSYTGAIYFNNVTYRNVHCAVCNYETDMAAMSCHETRTLDFKGPSMSFGMLLDIDLRHGAKVGRVEKRCEANEVYDPFSKKCRRIECPLPGFSLKDGKCVQD